MTQTKRQAEPQLACFLATEPSTPAHLNNLTVKVDIGKQTKNKAQFIMGAGGGGGEGEGGEGEGAQISPK